MGRWRGELGRRSGILVVGMALVGCVGPGQVPLEPATTPLPPPSADARVSFLTAVLAEARGETEEAERALRWVVRRDPHRAASHAWLARFLQRERRWAEAEAEWLEVLARDPHHAEAHAEVANLRGRAGDAEGELHHLEEAVAHGQDPAHHERLFTLRIEAEDPKGAGEVLDAWLTLELDDEMQHLHRARAARRLERHGDAVPDLARTRFGGLLWESAEASCRWQDALIWARSADLDDPMSRVVVADIAEEVGDASLLERALLRPAVAPPLPIVVEDWPAPRLPLSGPHEVQVRVAEAWRRAREPRQALRVLGTIDGRDDLVAIARARALFDVGAVAQALPALRRVDLSGPHGPEAVLLRLIGRDLTAEAALAALRRSPEALARLAAAAADRELVHVDTTLEVLVPGPPDAWEARDGALVLPAVSLGPWLTARDTRSSNRAFLGGRPEDARRILGEWMAREPDASVPYWRLARLEPERAREHLERGLAMNACDPDLWLVWRELVGDHPEGDPLERAVQVAPMHTRVRAAANLAASLRRHVEADPP